MAHSTLSESQQTMAANLGAERIEVLVSKYTMVASQNYRNENSMEFRQRPKSTHSTTAASNFMIQHAARCCYIY